MSWKSNSFICLLAYFVYLWKPWLPTPKVRDSLEEKYDYVIVGSGSAGSVIAARLSELDGATVAVLEAGDEETKYPAHETPLRVFELQKEDCDWQYLTEPQKHACQSLKNKQSVWPRGKVLGGTSIINGMMYVRGSRYDYDAWAANGCEGWSYADVLPYFIKSEDNTNDRFAKSGYHGTVGPIGVHDSDSTPILTKAFLDAGKEIGLNVTDINGKEQIGVMMNQASMRNGVRESTVRAFLRPAMARDNLHVLTRAHVTKILFEGKQAKGVEYHRDGRVHQVFARREVIVSGGAVNSPQLLMLSGIGPKKHLMDLGIPVLVDLPVGENLHDHIFTEAANYRLKSSDAILTERVTGWKSLLQYLVFGTGYLSSFGLDGTGFIRSSYQPQSDQYPYLQFVLFTTDMGQDKDQHESMINLYGFEEEAYQAIHGDGVNQEGVSLVPALLHPKEKGHIRLRSADPFDHPIIDPNYLAHEQDVQIMVEGIRLGQKMMNSTSFQKLSAQPSGNILPGCSHHEYDSDAYWSCYVRHLTFTVYHPVGTCKMGAKDDPTAVVDPQLRVKGVSNLRVADASIMPEIPSGNTNAPAIMVGEKAADMIKHTYYESQNKKNKRTT